MFSYTLPTNPPTPTVCVMLHISVTDYSTHLNNLKVVFLVVEKLILTLTETNNGLRSVG